jgi:hypothetical protein
MPILEVADTQALISADVVLFLNIRHAALERVDPVAQSLRRLCIWVAVIDVDVDPEVVAGVAARVEEGTPDRMLDV